MIYIFLLLILIFVLYENRKNNCLIENGNIIFKNLNENHNLESLMRDLLKQKIDDISKIEKAYYIFGNLKITFNKPYILIYNGKIDYDSLLKSRKSINFIYKYLNENKIKLSQVLYAIYINDSFYIVKT